MHEEHRISPRIRDGLDNGADRFDIGIEGRERWVGANGGERDAVTFVSGG